MQQIDLTLRALTFDAAAEMSGSSREAGTRLRQRYPAARAVPEQA